MRNENIALFDAFGCLLAHWRTEYTPPLNSEGNLS
jgi:hypothetical protein